MKSRTKIKNDKKKNNGGYTLVEILAAVAILVIVVIPLLHSFVSIARLNGKAKNEQEATTVAQNLMENIKAASMETLLASSETYKDEAGNVIEDEDGNPKMKVQVVPSESNPGEYMIYYNQCDFNGRTYRAVAKLDASTYRKEEETEEDLYNDVGLADITTMSNKSDAFYVQDVAGDTEAARHFGTESIVYPAMHRDITVDIDKSATGKATVHVTVKYEYNGVSYTNVENVCVYSNSGGTELETVYLFFQPMYTSNGGAAKESIHVNNNASLPVDVYLVKQNYDSTTEVQERNYRVDVDINETNRTEFTQDGSYYVLTNLQTNLDKSRNQMKLTYGGFSRQTIGGKSYTAEELLGIDTDSSLVKEIKKDRLYTVEISVYRVEDDTYGDALVTLTGTKEE